MLARMWRKGNPHTVLLGIQTDEAIVESSLELPQKKKLKGVLSYDPVIPLLEIYQKLTQNTNSKTICIPIFIAVLFTIAEI